jgi:hypothetical protein
MIADMVVATIIFPHMSKTSLCKPAKQAGLLYTCMGVNNNCPLLLFCYVNKLVHDDG